MVMIVTWWLWGVTMMNILFTFSFLLRYTPHQKSHISANMRPVSATPIDDTGSLSSPPRQVVFPPRSMVPPWMIASRFLVGNRKADLNPTTFSSLLLFRIFLFSMCALMPRMGLRGSALCASIPFLFPCLFFFPLSLALVHADPVEVGVGFCIIYI